MTQIPESGKQIQEARTALRTKGGLEEAEKLMVLIKPSKECSYQNVVDALDEAVINGVSRYAIVEPSHEESTLIGKPSPAKD